MNAALRRRLVAENDRLGREIRDTRESTAGRAAGDERLEALYPSDGQTVDSLLSNADEAMCCGARTGS
jgi:hypothetical protein